MKVTETRLQCLHFPPSFFLILLAFQTKYFTRIVLLLYTCICLRCRKGSNLWLNDIECFTNMITMGWPAEQENKLCQTVTVQSSHWAMSSKEGVKYRAGEKQTETEGTEMKTRSDGEIERNKKK